jgi:UDP-glucose 4-epimerase
MQEHCLVTGGAGFIGSHLVESLVRRGHPVRVLDNFDTGVRENLAPIAPAPEVIDGDVSDPSTVDRAVQGVNVVYHLAALASVQKSVEDPLASHRVCATGTLHVLDAARKHGVRRVVYPGSASAYGIPQHEVQAENSPLMPLSPYGAAKLAGEMYMEAFSNTYGLQTVRLRFFNVFGPRQRPDSPYSGVIALFVAALSEGRTPIIFGDGLQTRDFVYVADVVQALQKAAAVEGVSGKVYNIGAGRRVNLLELLAALSKQLGVDIPPEHRAARPGDIRHSCADISAARRDLGYDPQISFEDGLAQTLAWYREAR